MSKRRTVAPVQAPVDQLTVMQNKFAALKGLRDQINAMKDLYRQHDELMSELLPLFIRVEPDKFTVQREITLGTQKYRFCPFFYDTKKGKLLSKIWKSTAHESGTIE